MTGIVFGTDGWRATLKEFTEPRVRRVGQGVASHLRAVGRGGEPLLVGHDARESSPRFADALSEVLRANGHDVLRPERDCPTPLVAWGVVDRGLAGACMVTASHNPPEYNGVKFLPADGAPAMPEVTDSIEAHLAEPENPAEVPDGTERSVDLVEAHAVHALELVEADLAGLVVAYDAMHGSGRDVTDGLLERAGAIVERVRCGADPTFGGSRPEPSPELLGPLVDAVERSGADIGVANDGDADRLAVVTPGRGVLDENLFFAALYDHLLAAGNGPAVRTVSTTFLIDRIAATHGESVVEVPVGFKWVAAAMAEQDALVGGEESGGFTVRGHVREKDGVLMALLASTMAAQRPIDERVDALLDEHGTVVQGKRSVDCPNDRKAGALGALIDGFPETVAGTDVQTINDTDGVKALLADGSWVLVRPSGTEPVLRVYAEAANRDRLDALLEAGRALVEPLT